MSGQTQPKERRSPRKGGGFLPALCNILGTLILLAVLAAVLPATLPRLFGYEIYNVLTGSMEPEIPVGSILYVKAAPPEEIGEGDVIAFNASDATIVTHRVVKNRLVEGEFVTKGDANAGEDLDTVDYARLIGRVEYHFPVLGGLMSLYTTGVGKAYVVCFAACGAMLNLLGSRIRDNRRDEFDDEDEEEN